MFVENCRVEQESLKIEKTGKARRLERQKMKKMGMDPNEQPVRRLTLLGVSIAILRRPIISGFLQAAPEDLFLPVHCAVCSTNVAVMDHDEVYHFFNVLSGYA
ncbi:hypothetical protein Y032_0009g780 [Ancylostoma ceylanicum]|uniref:Uncharacterized protein n=1 Tax=Ancylostoma ceylanicum TaxID=53326 RepID=A0A016VJH2_9BILA|nr:hypothetical protein Y032_0009g780 [Ancylostoma ceylanicum]